MSDPFDLACSRLEQYGLRMFGPDRGRACCPAHGGKNRSALSVGRADSGAVLLRCWQGCTVEQVAHALGLDLVDLFPPKPQTGHGSGPQKRRRMLTAGQALDLLSAEITLAMVCASDMAQGRKLDEFTRKRLLKSAARVSVLKDEVHA
jgi:hypothetical protein